MPITTGYVASSYLLPDPYFNGGDAVNTISYGGKTYRKHTFSTVGSSTLSMVYPGIVNYAIVGGGGSGGAWYGGGGGAGAFYTGSIGVSSSQTIVTGAGADNIGQQDGYGGSSFNISAPGALYTGSFNITVTTGLSPTIGGSVFLNNVDGGISDRTITSYNPTTGLMGISSGSVYGTYSTSQWSMTIFAQVRGKNGSLSSIGSLIVAAGGGGGGATKDVEISAARTGGSGGGSGAEPYTTNVRSGAASTGGGNAGGSSYGAGAGGGGGYGSVGASATSSQSGANGGSGTSVGILGTTYRLAAGGGGSTVSGSGATNGLGGYVTGVKIGGDAGSVLPLSSPPYYTYSAAQPGVANTGSGGGGWGLGDPDGFPSGYLSSGAGGSGLVMIWYEINV